MKAAGIYSFGMCTYDSHKTDIMITFFLLLSPFVACLAPFIDYPFRVEEEEGTPKCKRKTEKTSVHTHTSMAGPQQLFGGPLLSHTHERWTTKKPFAARASSRLTLSESRFFESVLMAGAPSPLLNKTQ